MANHEITAVHLARLDLFGTARFDLQVLSYVVTRLALRLRMTALAQLRLLALRHDAPVMTQEAGVVLEERHWHGAPKRFRLVARSALGLSPLLLVFMTGEALAHGRQRRPFRVHHSRVTRHALAANFRHGQVLVVVDRNLTARSYRRYCQHGLYLMRVLMTAFTDGCAGHALPGIMRYHVVTADAAQARGLARHTAGDAGEVNLMRKAGRPRLTSTRGKRSQGQGKPEQENREASAHQ